MSGLGDLVKNISGSHKRTTSSGSSSAAMTTATIGAAQRIMVVPNSASTAQPLASATARLAGRPLTAGLTSGQQLTTATTAARVQPSSFTSSTRTGAAVRPSITGNSSSSKYGVSTAQSSDNEDSGDNSSGDESNSNGEFSTIATTAPAFVSLQQQQQQQSIKLQQFQAVTATQAAATAAQQMRQNTLQRTALNTATTAQHQRSSSLSAMTPTPTAASAAAAAARAAITATVTPPPAAAAAAVTAPKSLIMNILTNSNSSATSSSSNNYAAANRSNLVSLAAATAAATAVAAVNEITTATANSHGSSSNKPFNSISSKNNDSSNAVISTSSSKLALPLFRSPDEHDIIDLTYGTPITMQFASNSITDSSNSNHSSNSQLQQPIYLGMLPSGSNSNNKSSNSNNRNAALGSVGGCLNNNSCTLMLLLASDESNRGAVRFQDIVSILITNIHSDSGNSSSNSGNIGNSSNSSSSSNSIDCYYLCTSDTGALTLSKSAGDKKDNVLHKYIIQPFSQQQQQQQQLQQQSTANIQYLSGTVKISDLVSFKDTFNHFIALDNSSSNSYSSNSSNRVLCLSGAADDHQGLRVKKATVPHMPQWLLNNSSSNSNSKTKRSKKLQAQQQTMSSEQQEQLVVSDLLFALSGLDTSVIHKTTTAATAAATLSNSKASSNIISSPFESVFTVDTSVVADVSLLAVVNKLLPICNYYCYLYSYCYTRTNSYCYGRIIQQLTATINSSILKPYRVLLAQLEDLNNGNNSSSSHKLTLLQLWYYMSPSLQLFETLFDLIHNKLHNSNTLSNIISSNNNISSTAVVSGGHVLTVLYQQYHSTGDQQQQQLLLLLLNSCVTCYFDTLLLLWLTTGTTGSNDPFREFHIVNEAGNSNNTVTSTRDNNSNSDGSTSSSSRVSKKDSDRDNSGDKLINDLHENLPVFLMSHKEKIVQTGKYLNIMSISNVNSSRHSSSSSNNSSEENSSEQQQQAKAEFLQQQQVKLVFDVSDPSVYLNVIDDCYKRASQKLVYMFTATTVTTTVTSVAAVANDGSNSSQVVTTAAVAAAAVRTTITVPNDFNLLTHLQLIKNYFLFAQGDFLLLFVDNMRSSNSGSGSGSGSGRNNTAAGRIEAAMDLAIRTSFSNNSSNNGSNSINSSLGTHGKDNNNNPITCFMHVKSLLSQVLELKANSKGGQSEKQKAIAATAAATAVAPIDCVGLKYHVVWPLTLLLNGRVLSKYNSLFRHTLTVKLCEHKLSDSWKLQMTLKSMLPYSAGKQQVNSINSNNNNSENSSMPQSLWGRSYQLRHRMSSFVTELLYYMNVEVIEPLFDDMKRELMDVADAAEQQHNSGHHNSQLNSSSNSNTVDHLQTLLLSFLDQSTKHCLLAHPVMLRSLQSIINTCNDYCDQIERFVSSINTEIGSNSAESAASAAAGGPTIINRTYKQLTTTRSVQAQQLLSILQTASYQRTVAISTQLFDDQLFEFLSLLRTQSANTYDVHVTNLLSRLQGNDFYAEYFADRERVAAQNKAQEAAARQQLRQQQRQQEAAAAQQLHDSSNSHFYDDDRQ